MLDMAFAMLYLCKRKQTATPNRRETDGMATPYFDSDYRNLIKNGYEF